MKCTFKIILFSSALCNQLFSSSPEPMSPDAIIAQALELGYVPITDLSDQQLDAVIKESEQRLQKAKEKQDKENEDNGLGLQA